MTQRELKVGDVVQISPNSMSAFAGCFMLVTEPKSFGAEGFIAMPQAIAVRPGEAPYRCNWEEMEYIGSAAFVPPGEVRQTPAESFGDTGPVAAPIEPEASGS